jgi:hypothetical protein
VNAFNCAVSLRSLTEPILESASWSQSTTTSHEVGWFTGDKADRSAMLHFLRRFDGQLQ